MMKNVKNKITFVLVLLILMSVNTVSAKTNIIHKNSNGVIVSEKEYQFINDFYGEGYFNDMTMSEYDWIKDLNIDNSEVEINRVEDSTIMPFATSYTQNGKKVTIAKSCSSNCIIIVNCKWTATPNVKSYDVIGARLSNTSLASDTITTKITSSSGTEYSTELKQSSSGFGVSVKLPSSGTSISVEQKFTVSKSGTVYATYQHATSSISLANSKLYTINSNGYGGVFQFYGNASGVYDQMNGVSISL